MVEWLAPSKSSYVKADIHFSDVELTEEIYGPEYLWKSNKIFSLM